MRASHAVGGSLSALLGGEQPRSAVAVRPTGQREAYAKEGATVTLCDPVHDSAARQGHAHLPSCFFHGVITL